MRIYVQENIQVEFTARYKAALEQRAQSTGDPDPDSTTMGPLADEAQFKRVTGLIQRCEELIPHHWRKPGWH